VQGVARSNRAAPTNTQAQAVNTSHARGVNSISLSNSDLSLEAVRESFIRSSVHKSPKTVSTLSERLKPFTVYLSNVGIRNCLAITREHVDGFLIEIAKGRRGKPLSPASVFGFTKDVQAFINYIADNLAPEDCR